MMPKYQVTAPDGTSWEVQAPEGATPDQALAFAKSQWTAQKQPPPAAPAKKQLGEDPGFGQSALIGAGKTIDSVLDGITQMYLGARGEKSALGGLKANVQEKRDLYQPLAEARPWATGIGESLPSMVLPAGGGATLLGNAARMGAAGAIPGALEYGTLGERAGRATLGGLAGASIPLVGAGARSAKSLVEPLYAKGRATIAGRTLNAAAGDSAGAVVARLKGAAELVPGSAPTASQVAESGGIAALERAAAAANPEAYTQRSMEQASARLSALRGIAGDATKLKAANDARGAAADALYAQADNAIAPVDGYFRSLQQRPQFAAAVKRAEELAKNEGLTDIFFRQGGQPVALLGQGAHFIKKALDEAADFGSSSYTGKAGARAAGGTNELFQSWLQKSVPEYGAAKTAFAAGSRPVNQMEIGQELLDKLTPALGDYGALGKESAETFARTLRNADDTAARVTGMGGAKLASVMDAPQMQTLEGIARDLARKANAQDLGRGVGSDTFQKLSMANIAAQSGMPRAVGGLLDLPGVSRATAWMYRDADAKLQRELSEALLNPKKAAALMESASARKFLANNPKVRELLTQSAMRGGLLGAPAAAELVGQ
jgi:hypothetical protein